jgi:hypothetical protein
VMKIKPMGRNSDSFRACRSGVERAIPRLAVSVFCAVQKNRQMQFFSAGRHAADAP